MLRLLFLVVLLCMVEGSSHSSSRSSSYSSSKSSTSRSSSFTTKSYSSGKPARDVEPSASSKSNKSYSSGKSTSDIKPVKSFDSSSSSAQKAQQGKSAYDDYKAAKAPKIETPKYRSSKTEYRTRNERQKVVFHNYYNTRPTIVYQDNSWNPMFWMWLLDHRDRQAEWVYHHRSEISEERYRDLLAQNANLEMQLKELENQNLVRDPNYAPKDVDKDLMYANAAPEKDYTWVVITLIVVAFFVLVGGFYFMRI